MFHDCNVCPSYKHTNIQGVCRPWISFFNTGREKERRKQTDYCTSLNGELQTECLLFVDSQVRISYLQPLVCGIFQTILLVVNAFKTSL